MKKKLMLLGGLHYLFPVIDAAHRNGYHVITVDYLPNNIAHKFSDEYHNISILDKEAVLSLARSLRIDGIMSFAVDPGVVTAAYVAEQMGLPFQGAYDSVCILQDKAKFRRFLEENGFNVPKAKGYSNVEDALKDADLFNWPVIVKPVDSAGSKGVSRVNDVRSLQLAIEYALNESHSGQFIIEEFLEKVGYSSDSDCFTIDGELVLCSFSDQWFDNEADNPYTPSAYSWPSTLPVDIQDILRKELQRLFLLLNMKTGIYNVEVLLCTNGKPYIMEVSPRGGGNRLAEMVDKAMGTNLVDMSVRAAVGERVEISTSSVIHPLVEIILHSNVEGLFKEIKVHQDFQKEFSYETQLWVNEGERLDKFTGANKAIGTLVVHANCNENIRKILQNYKQWISVCVQ